MPNRLGPVHDAVSGRRRAVESPGRSVPARSRRPPPGLRWRAQVHRRSELEEPHPVLRVLPRRQRGRPGRQPPDRMDRDHPSADGVLRARAAGAAAHAGREHRRPQAPAAADHRRAGSPAVRLPANPALYQINTRVTLHERGVALGRRATLDDVDDSMLDEIADRGFSWVWFLGVWQTGPAGRAVSRANVKMVEECRRVLPDLRDEDITGSPFAIAAYTVHHDFGGDPALARLRERLKRRNLRLMLDFVPNHTAPDHPWVTTHPEYYIHGTDEDLARAPQNYARLNIGGRSVVLAFGRDPYFDGWADTFQLNYRHAGFREARVAELGAIADRCDGVRCDMAMLLQPAIIARTWGDRARPA